MVDDRERLFLPETLADPTWRCYMQMPGSDVEEIESQHINQLPKSAILWTPWPGAAWLDEWLMVGDNEEYLGAIRFASTLVRKGQVFWDIEPGDLALWGAEEHWTFPGSQFSLTQAQANYVLMRLARVRFMAAFPVGEQTALASYSRAIQQERNHL
jgi:hypothetical protein